MGLAAFQFLSLPQGSLLVAGAMMLLYIAARAAEDALTAGRMLPVRLAVSHWLPIAAVATFSLLLGEPDLAVGVTFGTAVASLSLVLGITTFLAPPMHTPIRGGRFAAFLLPLSVVALLAGFRGHLNLTHAAMFVAIGALLVGLARSSVDGFGGVKTPADEPAAGDDVPGESNGPDSVDGEMSAGQWVQLGLTIALAAVGGFAAARGAKQLTEGVRVFSIGVLAGSVLGPMLTLPMIGTGARAAQHGRSREGTLAFIVIAMLNLCVLLPLLVALSHARAASDLSLPLIDVISSGEGVLRYPLAVWRIDTVVLIALSMLLFPVGLGRWTLSRMEGFFLIIGYSIYLMMVTFSAAR